MIRGQTRLDNGVPANQKMSSTHPPCAPNTVAMVLIAACNIFHLLQYSPVDCFGSRNLLSFYPPLQGFNNAGIWSSRTQLQHRLSLSGHYISQKSLLLPAGFDLSQAAQNHHYCFFCFPRWWTGLSSGCSLKCLKCCFRHWGTSTDSAHHITANPTAGTIPVTNSHRDFPTFFWKPSRRSWGCY